MANFETQSTLRQRVQFDFKVGCICNNGATSWVYKNEDDGLTQCIHCGESYTVVLNGILYELCSYATSPANIYAILAEVMNDNTAANAADAIVAEVMNDSTATKAEDDIPTSHNEIGP